LGLDIVLKIGHNYPSGRASLLKLSKRLVVIERIEFYPFKNYVKVLTPYTSFIWKSGSFQK
jgi:hypothetical protein